jgi:hypothetical protein
LFDCSESSSEEFFRGKALDCALRMWTAGELLTPRVFEDYATGRDIV